MLIIDIACGILLAYGIFGLGNILVGILFDRLFGHGPWS